jgi:hypothetical protein
MAGAVATMACAPLACGSLLGIDDGLLKEDASTRPDAMAVAFEAGIPAESGDEAVAVEADPPAPAEAGCTPDPSWCDTHCGTSRDNCGESRVCPDDCPTEDTCSAGNVCQCQSRADWCNGRCEQTTDNCGKPVDCGSCEAGVSCFTNVCGCMPDTIATTCAGKECGQATNNCGLAVNCGVSGSTACPSSEVCLQDADTCCTPDNAGSCGNRCQVQVTNNCGASILCPSCPGGEVCTGGVCCVPNGCGGDCVDNCGQSSAACCPTPPPDGGTTPPPADSGGGGGCTAMGATCASNAACCSGACSNDGVCVSACGTSETSCSLSSAPCCIGLTCQSTIMPLDTSGSAPAPQLISNGRCQ